MLDLNRLKLLRELRRRGTITAVAQAFSFSPSAVSQQLATLEREAGVRLLEAAGRRVRLTSEAELLVAHAELLLEQMERAEADLAKSRREISGTLRVAAFQTAVMSLLPSALTSLQGAHPQLRIDVTVQEPDIALPALVAGDHDVVIAEEYPEQPLPRLGGTDRDHLLDDELVIVSPESWGAGALYDLADRPFVVEPADTPAGQWALATCRTAGFEPDVRYVTTDLNIHLRLVQSGLAGALVPELARPQDVFEVTVNRLPARPTRSIFAAVRRGSADRPSVQVFTDALVSASHTKG